MENKLDYSVQAVPQKRKGNGIIFSQKVAPYIFVSPFILSFLIFFLYPSISTIIMSFQEVLPGETKFIGVENYKKLLNPHFYAALRNTTIYTIWTLIILIPLPLVLAVILNSKAIPGRNFFRSAYFIPALTSTIVVGVVFRLIFGELESAPANALLKLLGLPAQQWTMHWGTGMFLMVFLASWKWLGVNILYFLSGLQSIPKELYESAEIDGAGMFRKFFYITLPLLKPVVIYVLTISIFGGFRMYEESFVFWQNQSPGDIGLTLVGYIYREGFINNDMGFGSAIGIVLLIIVFVINIIQLKVTGAFKKEG
ncbi:carbohydrate ABC transporter permease [Geobacillus thermodenitrificans]|uniref:Sugar ABC transporter permease n=2 Tax=Geobacillus thermodenitrificans TaxID=33940 RepID=A0ABY9Q731_GEOTD|nr:sugar ABC transporter permease [Geobacillus thermodenitrificans]ARA99614.1 arabinose transporter permease [Geobacillus thermodenitrificans]ARP42917.1 L-arabinose transport system permease protein AraP [Geobacillus thermodenitrificans]MEC5186853.1 arabinosaccharide transport system permease protein [Geobacillus thermodenitrificans]MED0661933.1 sugar ABC transporter permease [Geobacillus thermodenitrificans]MED4917259.1 sugar ABC transporter permease [Geobacillus thermodenitrificans]